ncbi:alpha/beta hydrolase [Nocardiopsis sp. ATB16-24]|uniref:alpha/beta hydrolase n=1 Tax=Nocardiopsis sp. ATB16-24 TaxID=3019555 RepID=UPI0025526B84|nr:alpha/beta hydrolase [Nocardiopsis sp. ATB16-24]
MGSARRGRRLRGRLKAAGAALALVLVVAVGGFVVWASTPYEAEPEALREATASGVEVSVDGDVVIAPVEGGAEAGVVFYPGARVAPEAYVASWAPIVAETSVLVVIPRMPLNLAVFDPDLAASVIAEGIGGVDEWYVGGHSLGGAMAASYVGGRTPDTVRGLVLWGSYATEGARLSGRDDLEVVSVSGSRDGLSTPTAVRERRDLLPGDALVHEIEGMNHAQFGAYGDQSGDGVPEIDDEEARRALVEVMSAFLS